MLDQGRPYQAIAALEEVEEDPATLVDRDTRAVAAEALELATALRLPQR